MNGNVGYVYHKNYVDFFGPSIMPRKYWVTYTGSVLVGFVWLLVQVYLFGYFAASVLFACMMVPNLGPHLIPYLLIPRDKRTKELRKEYNRAKKFHMLLFSLFPVSTAYIFALAWWPTPGVQVLIGCIYGSTVWLIKEESLLMYSDVTRRSGINVRTHSVLIDKTANLFVCMAFPEISSLGGFMGTLVPHAMAFAMNALVATPWGTSLVLSSLSSIPCLRNRFKSSNSTRMLKRRATSIQLMALGYVLTSLIYLIMAPLMRFGPSRTNYAMAYYPLERYHNSLMYALIWPIPFVMVAAVHRWYIYPILKVDPLYIVQRFVQRHLHTLLATTISTLSIVSLVLIKHGQIIWYVYPKNGSTE